MPLAQDEVRVVVLQPAKRGVAPLYPAVALATCLTCPGWVWLGIRSSEMVKNGQARPVCAPCARRHAARLLLVDIGDRVE